MSILSGPEIRRQIDLGNIVIDPFEPAQLGPNSYDVRLDDFLLSALDPYFDLTMPIQEVKKQVISADGLLLERGVGYLGNIIERVRCKGYVPWLDGRSTVGRYFLQVHQTAGRGDDGWDGQFTIELMAMYRPVRVYAGLLIAQLTFFTLEGEPAPYRGRYQQQQGPTLPKPLQRCDSGNPLSEPLQESSEW